MRIFSLFLMCLCVVPDRALACLWNYDSLAMERQRFPKTHELIEGYFVRHSPVYYEWCIADRMANPIDQRTPLDYDDLAVAYDKLGRHDEAIAMIHAKIKRWPDKRRYESEANLGTLLIHAGHLEEGLRHIDRAIEMNPDAHFGREIYQKLLVEYLLAQGGKDADLPLEEDDSVGRTAGFTEFVLARQKPEQGAELDEIKRAIKGVLGMMRFGHHDSPILLEALGDLLLTENHRTSSRLVAARAYLKASYEVTDSTASAAYRQKAQSILELKQGWKFIQLEADLAIEMKQGDDFFRKIVHNEQAWVDRGRNLDVEFAKKYYEAPPLALNQPNWKPMDPTTQIALIIGGGLTFLGLISFLIFVLVLRRLRTKRALSPT